VRSRIGVCVVLLVLSALSVASAEATVKKFAVKTTVEAELGADGKPTGFLVGKVTSPVSWCERKAHVTIEASSADGSFDANTETNGKGEWRLLSGNSELSGRSVVVVVKSPDGYGPKLGKHTQAACKSYRTKVVF